MSSFVSTYLNYANLQMAAEATRLDEVIAGTLTLAAALEAGNNRSSKFTPTQASQFIADGWAVAAHQANTGTGFSGTLFRYNGTTDLSRGLVNGELVLIGPTGGKPSRASGGEDAVTLPPTPSTVSRLGAYRMAVHRGIAEP